jgi:hypothetical protein
MTERIAEELADDHSRVVEDVLVDPGTAERDRQVEASGTGCRRRER